MGNLARLIAAGGALAGGYMQGKKMQEDSEWEKEKRQREREAMQIEADTRQAAASTIGAVGTQTGAAASGEEAMAAGNQALTAALAQAKSPEEAAAINERFAPTMAALVAQQGVPEKAGSTYTEEQAGKDYIAKMRGIDPAKARQEQLGQLQVDREQRTADYEKGKMGAFSGTPVAKAIAEGRQPTIGEQFQTAAHLFYFDAERGKATPQGMMELAGKMQQHETENYTKAVQALHSGASKETIAKVFNASGMQVDPAKISDPRPVEVDIGGGQKVKTFEITYTDERGGVHVLNGRRELDALGKGAESFNQAVALANLKNSTTQAGVAAAANSRAQEKHNLELPAAQVAATLGTLRQAYAGETDDKAKAAILDKINALQATGGADKDAPAEVKLANAFRRSGLAKTDAEALKMATTTKDLSPEKMRFELTKSLSSQIGATPESVKKQVDAFMGTLSGGGAAAPAKAGWGVKEITDKK